MTFGGRYLCARKELLPIILQGAMSAQNPVAGGGEDSGDDVDHRRRAIYALRDMEEGSGSHSIELSTIKSGGISKSDRGLD
ncbi:hypothetical protein EV182_001834 [Spiromyces aspiralis]|uniref:Uncharacterized protein n=1 Tax=Spiromyces aspiralis TaxID=68401 RepID=A0ACC1HU34_9FUNG|nr:hypothetical protein EV182_001834 [Spiromyces aspiralis]